MTLSQANKLRNIGCLIIEVRTNINVKSLKTFLAKLSVITRHPLQLWGPQAGPRCLLMTLSRQRPENNTDDNRKSGHNGILHEGRGVWVGKNESELFIRVQSLTRASGQSPSLSASVSLGTRGRGRAWVVRVKDTRKNIKYTPAADSTPLSVLRVDSGHVGSVFSEQPRQSDWWSQEVLTLTQCLMPCYAISDVHGSALTLRYNKNINWR